MEMSLGALNAPARPDTLLSGDGDESWSMLANLKSPMHPDLDLEGDGGDGVPDETLTASGKLCSWQDRAVSRSSAPSSSTALDDETDFSLSVLTEESEAHGDIDPWFAEDMEEFGDGGLPEEPMMRKVNSTSSFRKQAVRARRERIRAEQREEVVDFLQRNNFAGINAPRSPWASGCSRNRYTPSTWLPRKEMLAWYKSFFEKGRILTRGPRPGVRRWTWQTQRTSLALTAWCSRSCPDGGTP